MAEYKSSIRDSYLQRFWPVCFICKKPVEQFDRKLTWDEDSYRFIVECHGQKEEMVIKREAFATLNFNKGIAFFKLEIEEQKKIMEK